MKRCSGCGRNTVPIRDDGECFRCHVAGIGFTFTGGGRYGRAHWNTTQREHLAEHVGDTRRDDIELVP